MFYIPNHVLLHVEIFYTRYNKSKGEATMKKMSLLFFVALLVGFLANDVTFAENCVKEGTVIQTLINEKAEKGGGEVHLEACTYEITDSVRFKSDVSLIGEGEDKTKLVLKATNDDGTLNKNKALIADRVTNVSLSNLSIDGQKQKRSALINDPYAHTVEFAHVTNFHVTDVSIQNSTGASIVMYRAKHGVIEDTTITDSGSNGILGMMDTEEVVIKRNTIDKTDHQNGIFFMYQNGESAKNIQIENNVVKNAADYAIEVGHTTHTSSDPPHEDITVKNNTIENAYCTGIGFRTVSNGVIENNKITGYAKAHDYGCNAVFVEGRVSQSENVDVRNNVIEQTAAKVENQKYPYQQAMYVTGMRDMKIEGNYIKNSWNDAITVLAAYFSGSTPDFPNGQRLYQNISLLDNVVLNAERHGIYVTAPSRGNTANGNILVGSGGAGYDISTDSGFSLNNNKRYDNAEGENDATKPSIPEPPKAGASFVEEEEPTPPLEKPITPQIKTQSATETQVTFSWDAVEGVTTYIVKRDDAVVFEGKDTSFTEENLSPNTSYTYTLASKNEVGVSEEVTVKVQTKTAEEEEEEEEEKENIWTKGDFTPLFGWVSEPLTAPGVYTVSFEAKSNGDGELEVFASDRRLFNEIVNTTDEWKTHTYSFSTFYDRGDTLLFHPASGENMHVRNIVVTNATGDVPVSPPESESTLEARVASFAEKVNDFYKQNQSKAEELMDAFDSILTLF